MKTSNKMKNFKSIRKSLHEYKYFRNVFEYEYFTFLTKVFEYEYFLKCIRILMNTNTFCPGLLL